MMPPPNLFSDGHHPPPLKTQQY